MTPPRDRHRSELSDTGRELLAIIDEHVQRIRNERHTQSVAESPGASESSEHIRAISSQVADGVVTSHKLHCLMPGGVLHAVADKLEQRMENVEAKQKEQGDFIAQYLGEQKFKRFVLPILIGFMGSTAGVAVMMLLFKALAGSVKP